KLHVPDTLHTAEIRSGRLARLADLWPTFQGSAANAVIALAIVAMIVLFWFLFRTRRGFELRAVGLQPHAAEYAGIDVGRVTWRALALSGAIAGIGGGNDVRRYTHSHAGGFGRGRRLACRPLPVPRPRHPPSLVR